VFAKKIKKISKKPEVVSSIYIDFFKFISLRETLLMDRCKLELGKSLEKNIFNNIEELDKETLFKSMILRKLEKFDNGEIKDEVISGILHALSVKDELIPIDDSSIGFITRKVNEAKNALKNNFSNAKKELEERYEKHLNMMKSQERKQKAIEMNVSIKNNVNSLTVPIGIN